MLNRLILLRLGLQLLRVLIISWLVDLPVLVLEIGERHLRWENLVVFARYLLELILVLVRNLISSYSIDGDDHVRGLRVQ